jgi:hypothetical protein
MSATATRKLFVNFLKKTLQISDINGGAFVLPALNKYEAVPFEIVILEPASSRGLDRFTRMDVSALSLSIAVNDTYDDAAPLAYQNIWTKDEVDNVFSGELSLNTAALNSWIGSESSKAAYFEIAITEGTDRSVIYIASITLQNAVTQSGAVVPTPVDEFYTKAQADSQFVRKIEDGFITVQSPGGTYQRVIGVDDGGAAIDQILPV